MHLVVHYAELGLKGKNRPQFEKRLQNNLVRALSDLGRVEVRNLYGRLLVELPDSIDADALQSRLDRVFGVAYTSRVTVIEPDVDAIAEAVDAFVDARTFASFGVRARRVDKGFPLRSNELAAELGARVVERTGAKVDLGDPELWIEVHVLSKSALLLHEKVPGPGGLPVGTAGKAVCLISGGIDSPVAAQEMARRGLELYFVHFHSAPFTSPASQEKVREIVGRLARSQLSARNGRTPLFMVPFGELQRTLVRCAPPEPRIVLYRRFMIRIAEALAERIGARALVTGDSLGQVSSQTLGNLDTINRAATLPVLRPLIALDKGDIVRRAQALGSFPISIEPDEDCCSYLMPRKPATWTRPEEIEAIEHELDVKGMVSEALDHVAEERIEASP